MADPVAFTTTVDTVITTITNVSGFFVSQFVTIADMLFQSPFMIFLGITVCLIILSTVAGYLGIRRRGGRRRR
ncbi:hypothetical protein J6C36_00930 [Methanocorpusculaceae archaeon]|nr:hypothetical protein [Methanocorpusculaceae archaeon]MBO5430566.1 hypothetical protein [Methanocorpusculum sp.]MBP3444060.1 hypothetical protein [Methanocorpusculaceae archaeon]